MKHESSPPTEIARAMYDPLDLHIRRLGVPKRSSWSRLSSQSTLLLLTGVALGPQGLAVLTPAVLEVLRPAVPVALAVLGVSTVLGSTAHGGVPLRHTYPSSFLILVAGLAMAVHQRELVDAAAIIGQAACIAVLLAGAGWMLSSSGARDEERRVFSITIFLLLGGVADYLSVSALLLGWIAATAWQLVQTRQLSEVRLDAAYVQHPMTALLLVTAGARVQLSWQVVLLGVAAVSVTMASVLFFRRRRPIRDMTFGGIPVTPAAFAVALAMDATRLDPRLTMLLSIVVLAASIFDVVSDHLAEDAA